MADEPSDQIIDMLAGIQGRTISEQALRDLVAERDAWKGRAEELSGIEDVSIQQTQRALAAEAERDAAQHAIELAAAALAGALHHTEALAAELVQANDSYEAAEKKAARWREGFAAECEARAAAETARDAAVVERDAWGGKAATASHELHLIRHQRNEVVSALAELLGSLRSAALDVINGDPVTGDMVGPAKRAEALVDLYARAAELRSQEPLRCAHGHAGCCGHHDPEDMPLPPHGPCFQPTAPPSEEGQPT